jgi:hypothetical protein
MTDLTVTEAKPKTAADYKSAIDHLVVGMLESEATTRQDRVEIERIRAESQVIARHTDAVLERLDKQLEALGRAA